MQFEWVILVGQIVRGKSKFPKQLGFKRYKPWNYNDSNKPHRILYAKHFVCDEAKANAMASEVDSKMFRMYITSLDNLEHSCISEYTIILHDVTKNISKQICTTSKGSDTEQRILLYSDVPCTNKQLSKWGIVKGL